MDEDRYDWEGVRHCTMCDRWGYLPGGKTCDHIDHTQANRRGMAKIREVLGDKPVRPGLRRSMSSQELVAYQRSVRPAAPIGDPEPNLAGGEVN